MQWFLILDLGFSDVRIEPFCLETIERASLANMPRIEKGFVDFDIEVTDAL